MVVLCKDRLLDLTTPQIMGIINVTPDSFYRQSRVNSEEQALNKAEEMYEAGATIIDIGGMSTRPGAKIIDPQEEMNRILPIVKAIRKSLPHCFISVDTTWGATAQAVLSEGCDVINDVSAGSIDPEMHKVIATEQPAYILMHMQGSPDVMQQNPLYTDVTQEIIRFFLKSVDNLRKKGIEEVIIDPGFGFGKSMDHNYQLLSDLSLFRLIKKPIMVGLSRKSMLYKALDIGPEEALPATMVAHYEALKQGAHILRVHDVPEAKQVITLFKKMNLK